MLMHYNGDRPDGSTPEEKIIQRDLVKGKR